MLKIVFTEGKDYLKSEETGQAMTKDFIYVTKVVLPRQLKQDPFSLKYMESLLYLVELIVENLFLILLLCLIFDLYLGDLWIFCSAVAILSHVGLNKVTKHAYSELAYAMLMDMIRIDIYGWKDRFDIWLFEKYNFTTTQSLSSSYFTMGYKSRNVVSNVGPLNGVILLFFLCVVI